MAARPMSGRATRALSAFKKYGRSITFKHEATPLTAFVGSLVALGGLQLVQSLVKLAADQAMLLIGSFAALATLLFAAPAAPLGVPWNTILGHTVSIAIALVFHWVQLAAGTNLYAHVLAPSVAIGAMAHLRIANPPAAAACFILLTSAKAKAQPLLGAFYLVAPALTGCLWCLLVQFGLARGLAALKRWRAPPSKGATPASKPQHAKRITVDVDIVDPAVATCLVQAIEGAAYVSDPLSFVIDALSADRARMNRKKAAVLKAFTSKRAVGPMAPLERDEAAARIQVAVRKLLAARAFEAKAAPVDPKGQEQGGWFFSGNAALAA